MDSSRRREWAPIASGEKQSSMVARAAMPSACLSSGFRRILTIRSAAWWTSGSAQVWPCAYGPSLWSSVTRRARTGVSLVSFRYSAVADQSVAKKAAGESGQVERTMPSGPMSCRPGQPASRPCACGWTTEWPKTEIVPGDEPVGRTILAQSRIQADPGSNSSKKSPLKPRWRCGSLDLRLGWISPGTVVRELIPIPPDDKPLRRSDLRSPRRLGESLRRRHQGSNS